MHTPARRARLGLTAIAATAALIALATPALGAQVSAVYHAGNPKCADLGFARELKADAGALGGTTVHSNSHGTITVTIDAAMKTVAFSAANPPVSAVIVKAGNGANVYVYNPAVAADSNLVTPMNGGGQQAALSHLSVCFGTTSASTPTPTPTPTQVTNPTPTPTPTPEGSQAGSTGTPRASASPTGGVAGSTSTPRGRTLPDTAGEAPSDATVILWFGAVLLASVASMAYATTAERRRRA